MIDDLGFGELLILGYLQIRMGKLDVLRHFIRLLCLEMLNCCDMPHCLPHIITEILFSMHSLDLIFHKARE